MADQRIRTAHTCAADPCLAAEEFHAAVAQPEMALVLFYCSSHYDLPRLAAEINRLFAGVTVIGCTTAGEIGPAGYRDHSLTGASFPAGSFHAVTGRIDDLQGFEMAAGRDFAQSLLRDLEAQVPTAGPDNSFALLLIDGLSVREEPVTRSVQEGLGALPLIGGSAGDDMKFDRTWVFHDGAFHTDSAVVVLINTVFPFRVFKTQHFVATDERLVVTEADAERRVVREINGLPAAAEYARLIGSPGDTLAPSQFAAAPVVVLIDGGDYVRAIQKANADGSLTLYCAIDEGLVLRVARGVDLVASMEQAFADLRDAIGPPQLTLACDCILRNLEVSQSDRKEQVREIFARNNTIGFSTYGEQFGGVHVNQTLTGIAIGSTPVQRTRDDDR